MSDDSDPGGDGEGADGGDRDPFDSFDGHRDREGDPLADVEAPDGDPFESNASAFERSGVEGIDPDEVWERLTDSGNADSEPDTESESDSESDADATAEAGAAETSPPGGEGDVAVVSKHAYCEGCEHFSPPPDVTCSHEGTEILEFVDVDSVRVADCPVVAERRELEDGA